MRLICPNCDAEYEVDASLVPPEGRDVQCSNCSNTWFQKRDMGEDDVELMTAQSASLTPPRTATDPKALDIIHEEVRREVRARASDTTSLETQTDLGLDAPADTPPFAQTQAEPEVVTDEDDPALAAAPQRGEGGKRELLPDIEEINSTLASAPDPDEYEEEDMVAAPRLRSRFRIGFGLMLMLTAVILVLYARAPQLAERFPQFSGQLMVYVTFMDGLRLMLDSGAQALLEQVNELTERFRNT